MATQTEVAPDTRGAFDPDLARMRRDGALTLGFSPGTVELLGALSRRIGAPVAEVLTEALALLAVAVDAQEDGLRVCLADDDLNVVREIVGFGIADEDEPDEDPAAGSEADES